MAPSIRLQLVAWVLGPLTAFFALSGLAPATGTPDARPNSSPTRHCSVRPAASPNASRRPTGWSRRLIPPSALERIVDEPARPRHLQGVLARRRAAGRLSRRAGAAGAALVSRSELVRRHIPGAARARSRDWAARRGPLRRLRGRNRRRDQHGRAELWPTASGVGPRARGLMVLLTGVLVLSACARDCGRFCAFVTTCARDRRARSAGSSGGTSSPRSGRWSMHSTPRSRPSSDRWSDATA